jgi:hypothetical protein
VIGFLIRDRRERFVTQRNTVKMVTEIVVIEL